MTTPDSYSLAIIGSGSGGAEAALLAARRGAPRVLLAEKNQIGGGALHTGTIPMRSLMASERMLRQMRRDADRRGFEPIDGQYEEDSLQARFADWLNRQRHAVARLTYQLEEELRAAGVEAVRGTVRLLGNGRLLIAEKNRRPEEPEREVRADHIIIATGAKPNTPEQVWPDCAVGVSNRFLSLAETPENLAIVGGGHIGCEFAAIYNALGTRVTLIEKCERLLPEMDREAGERLRAEFENRGIHVRLGREVRAVWGGTSKEFGLIEFLPDHEELAADKVLLATGRAPNVQGLGLEEAGVLYDARRGIRVDEFLQTSAPGISAIGDVNGLCALADSAKAQARVAVENALGGRTPFRAAGGLRCIHSDPAVAAVGLLEDDARAQGRPVRTASATLRTPPGAPAGSTGDWSGGLVKLVCDAESGILLGGMIVAERAPEWIGELSVAVQLRASIKDLAAAPRSNESFAEAVQTCARAIGK